MIPDIIYLQFSAEAGDMYKDDATWCDSRVFATDVEYRRIRPAVTFARTMKFTILARHSHWVSGAKITESVAANGEEVGGLSIHRFTATIDGWQNWRIYEGPTELDTVQFVIARVREIQARIRAGDESVFSEPNSWAVPHPTGDG